MFIESADIPDFLGGIPLFGKLDAEQIDLVIQNLEQKLYPAGKVIYEAGGDAETFYILYKGKVQLQRYVEDEPDYTAVVESGDYFGQEALRGGEYRQTSAVAQEDTITLEISADDLMDVRREIPVLDTRLNLVQNSFDLIWSLNLRWRETDELIYYVARRHPIILLLHLLLPGALLLAGFLVLVLAIAGILTQTTPLILSSAMIVIGLGWGVWNFIDWSNDYFIITDRRVIHLEKIILLYDSRSEAPMEAVLNVSQKTTLLGRWFGFGDISIKSFTGMVIFTDIGSPQEVQTIMERMMRRAKGRKEREQRKNIRATLKNRLEPQPVKKPQPTPKSANDEEDEDAEVDYTPGFLSKALSNLFLARWEENGIITYRKHWLILVEHTWMPSLLLLGLFALFVMRIAGVYTFISFDAMLLLLFMLGLVIFVWWLYQYVDWKNDVYIVTGDQIIDVYKKPLGTETRKSAPLKNILSIEYRRLGFIGYLFNFGTVYVKVGETTFDFDYVYNPSEVQRELFQRYSEFMYREKKSQEDADARRMTDWLEEYHDWSEEHS